MPRAQDCAEVALVMLTMFQRSSTTRMASEKAGLTEATIVTCAQVIAKVRRTLFSLEGLLCRTSNAHFDPKRSNP
jgi:hypothetical protein